MAITLEHLWLVDANQQRANVLQHAFEGHDDIDVMHGSVMRLPHVLRVDAYVMGITSTGTLLQPSQMDLPSWRQRPVFETASKQTVAQLKLKSTLDRPIMPVGSAAFLKDFQGPPHAIVTPVQFPDRFDTQTLKRGDRTDNLLQAYRAIFYLVHAYNRYARHARLRPIRRVASCIVGSPQVIADAWYGFKPKRKDGALVMNQRVWVPSHLAGAQESCDALLEFEPYFEGYLKPPSKTPPLALTEPALNHLLHSQTPSSSSMLRASSLTQQQHLQKQLDQEEHEGQLLLTSWQKLTPSSHDHQQPSSTQSTASKRANKERRRRHKSSSRHHNKKKHKRTR